MKMYRQSAHAQGQRHENTYLLLVLGDYRRSTGFEARPSMEIQAEPEKKGRLRTAM